VKLIDDSLGRIVERLEADGLLDETILVFTTDHGEYAGEHGLQAKNQVYETAYRIPMIVHWPRGIRPGRRVESVMSTVDFQPTILGLMGVKGSGREEGRDASSLLTGNPPEKWDDVTFVNRQGGSGTRVLFDYKLQQAGIEPEWKMHGRDLNGLLTNPEQKLGEPMLMINTTYEYGDRVVEALRRYNRLGG